MADDLSSFVSTIQPGADSRSRVCGEKFGRTGETPIAGFARTTRGCCWRTVGIGPGIQVVDLCCGDGHFTKPMCHLVHPGNTSALDLDADLLGQTKQACRENPNFHAILGDAHELPAWINEPVDFVFIANTFHGVPDKTALSRAVCDVLKKNGRFAVVNWYRRSREETTVLDQPRGPSTELRMGPEDVRQVVEPAGFTLEKVVGVGPYHYGAVFIKSTNNHQEID